MYKLAAVVTGMVATNCYTLFNEDTKEAILIDASGNANTLLRTVREEGLSPKAILLTHAHFDHMDGVEGIRKEYPDIEVIIGENDAPLLDNPSVNLSLAFTGIPVSIKADRTVKDGEEIELIGLKIKCIEVSGHTIGGMCYYIESLPPSGDGVSQSMTNKGVLFDGDTLFHGSVGRSDFPTGDAEALLKNIREKLFTLPDDTQVFPGHDSETTIRWEKTYNPYFNN